MEVTILLEFYLSLALAMRPLTFRAIFLMGSSTVSNRVIMLHKHALHLKASRPILSGRDRTRTCTPSKRYRFSKPGRYQLRFTLPIPGLFKECPSKILLFVVVNGIEPLSLGPKPNVLAFILNDHKIEQ